MIQKNFLKSHVSSVFSFIHASDLHLGSHQYRNEERANDFIDALKQILYLAKFHRVDFIILGGDVFNSLEMLPGNLTEIISIFTQFNLSVNNQIKIIAIEGNHDIRRSSFGVRFKTRGQSWLKLIASLNLLVLLDANLNEQPNHRFPYYNFKTQSGGKIRIKDAVIYGTRYYGENPKEELIKIMEGIDKNDGLYHILVQHFGIEGQMENVPGLSYQDISCFKKGIHYLALGHFHLQFIINNWIYNPGSAEAACTSDFFFKRGIFLVRVSHENEYKKEVTELKLNNRKAVWMKIYIKRPFRSKENLYNYILKSLQIEIKKYDPSIVNLSNNNKPCLFLKLNGVKPFKTCKINEKDLNQLICENFPFVNVKIYQKFKEPIKSITKYF